jgi:pilus assembly protein CpaF
MTVPSGSSGRELTSANLLKLKHYLIENITRMLESEKVEAEQRRPFVTQRLQQIYEQTRLQLAEGVRQQLFQDVLNELLGYGPIQPLLDDPEIDEVMVNGPSQVYVERNGLLVKTPVTFEDDAHVLRIIERIILPLGRHIEPDSPSVDARLPDGSRVNAVIPPVAIDGPSITVRKFRKEKLSVEQLIQLGSLTQGMADFLRACVISKLNILISGGTGSGKTTMLNVLSGFIPENERIVTIEDAAELRLQQEHVVRLEARPPNVEGRGLVTIRDLVRNALRMRPDRIVVGEVRGPEALDMLQAMNTGHDGSLTTLHANSPRDAASRLETMVMMAGMELPLKVVRQQISSAVDLIVQQSRLKDGSRKIISITEVAGMEGDTIVMTEIFRFEQTGVDTEGRVVGSLRPTGMRPLFSSRLQAAGFRLGPEVFSSSLANLRRDRQHR